MKINANKLKLLSHLNPQVSVAIETSQTTNHEFEKFSKNERLFHNWANISFCRPMYYHEPSTPSEMIEIITYASQNQQKVRVMGSGQSPSNISFLNII